MRLVVFLILGLASFDVALSRGLGQLFSQWYDEVFDDSEESSETSFCDILSQIFGLDFDDDDDDSQESTSPVDHQLPGGPSWIETMYPSEPQMPGPAGVDQGQRPSPTTNPFNPQQQQQPQGQLPPHLSSSFKPIPNRPPEEQSPFSETPVLKPGENPTPSNATEPPASPLIISIAGDEVDDTDGLGVLEREQETG